MQLVSKSHKSFFVCVFHFFSKYAWVITEKGITITNASQKSLEKSNRKPNKIWIDKGSEFYNGSMKSWLKKCYRNAFST